MSANPEQRKVGTFPTEDCSARGLVDLRVDWSTYGGPYLVVPEHLCGVARGWRVASLHFASWAPFKQQKEVATFIVDACRLHVANADLLAALHKAHDYLDRNGNGWDEADTLEAVRAAIAKATTP